MKFHTYNPTETFVHDIEVLHFVADKYSFDSHAKVHLIYCISHSAHLWLVPAMFILED